MRKDAPVPAPVCDALAMGVDYRELSMLTRRVLSGTFEGTNQLALTRDPCRDACHDTKLTREAQPCLKSLASLFSSCPSS